MYTDAVTLVAEVIELKVKPSQPRGTVEQTAFGEASPDTDRGLISRAILAIGHQDTDPDGLCPPPGITVLGASSDHLITDSSGCRLCVGKEVTFELNYSALVRAMTSPFVAKAVKARSRTERYANNRAEVSHQPTRQRERQMRGFTSSDHAQRFLHVHGVIQNLFRVGRHLLRAAHHRMLRARSFTV